MTRELKFRAWDGEHKEMVQAINWFIEIDDGTVWENINVCGEDDLHERYVKLMQFTGLLDKHGREIYEGDIIKYKWLSEFPVDVVRWNDRLAEFNAYSLQHGEVIGNIYEHAELLEEWA